MQTRPFRVARTTYIACVSVCYAAPVLTYRLPVSEESLEAMWLSCLIVSMLLAAAGFLWSAFSALARYSLAVFFATLASYVCIAWLFIWAS